MAQRRFGTHFSTTLSDEAKEAIDRACSEFGIKKSTLIEGLLFGIYVTDPVTRKILHNHLAVE